MRKRILLLTLVLTLLMVVSLASIAPSAEYIRDPNGGGGKTRTKSLATSRTSSARTVTTTVTRTTTETVTTTPTIVSYVSSQETLFVEGSAIRNMRGPVTLIGVNYFGISVIGTNLPPNVWTYSRQHSVLIAGYGFNVVRLPFYWNYMEISPSPSIFLYDYEYMRNFVGAVRTFTAEGLYIIIDAHTVESNEHTSNLRNFLPVSPSNYRFKESFFADTGNYSGREHLRKLWVELTNFQLSDGYCLRTDPKVAGYDILNEPHHETLTESGTTSERQDLHEKWYKIMDYVTATLRQNNDHHIVFAEEVPWAGTSVFMNRTLEDSNVAYSLHFYRGLDLTSMNVTNNAIDYLRSQFTGSWGVGNKKQVFPNVPFLVLEFGHLYDDSIGDEKNIWIHNALTIFKQAAMAGWTWFMFGCTPDGYIWSKGTFIEELQTSG